jgi:hypothetical protein
VPFLRQDVPPRVTPVKVQLSPISAAADDHPHAVIDEEAAADFGAGMDLDAGEKTADVGGEPGEEVEPPQPEAMGQPMEEHGVKPGIAENDFELAAHCRVTLENDLEILLQGSKHASVSFATGDRERRFS